MVQCAFKTLNLQIQLVFLVRKLNFKVLNLLSKLLFPESRISGDFLIVLSEALGLFLKGQVLRLNFFDMAFHFPTHYDFKMVEFLCKFLFFTKKLGPGHFMLFGQKLVLLFVDEKSLS